MRRTLLIPGAVLVFGGLVAFYAQASLRESERRVMEAAETEGRALLSALNAGVSRSIEASRAVERLVAERLLELARAVEDDLASAPGQEERKLVNFVKRHRLKGALLLDAGFAPVASAEGGPPRLGPGAGLGPAVGGGLSPRVIDDLVRRARERGLGEEPAVVVGFGENPFGTRAEFLVGARIRLTGGYLLLRQDAEELRSVREEAGVLQLLLEAAESDGIAYLLILDEAGSVVAASDPALVGRAPPPPDPGAVWEMRVASGEGGGMLVAGLDTGPVQSVLRQGRRRTLLFTFYAVALAAGGAVAFVVLDGLRRRREALLSRALAERERAASLGQLAAGVAHEIRSPLNAISMAAQRLARAGSGDAAEGEILAALRREVARLNRTVEEFLDLGRVRPLSKRPVEIGPLVEEVVRAEAPQARVDAPAGAIVLVADAEELRKALANVVRNARQAAGDGPVVVAFRRERGAVAIEVRDGGPGVPPGDRERIFGHFVSGR
ncbi:MAG: ATP-binding protein, partial [Planctomycetes bacterium]|nr:ATP-binding protein [Planctomycetota bacterium]